MMKSSQGLTVAFAAFAVVFFFMTAWSLFRMAELNERTRNLEGSRNEFREPKKNDPLRSFTGAEADEWLQYCEDTPENRKKWAEAGTPMSFGK
jgi:hypothetical protein